MPRHPEFSEENAMDIIKAEVGAVFEQVLRDAGVFKRDEKGQAAFDRFMKEVVNVCKVSRDAKKVNESKADEKKRIPFPHMLYFGDGETDIPCMKIVGMFGGNPIAVYDPANHKKKATAQKLKRQGRVSFVTPAVYTADSRTFRLVCAIIDKIAAEENLKSLANFR